MDWKHQLEQLRRSLVRPLGSDVDLHDDELAFERHVQLATRIGRAAQLSGRVRGSQRDRWVDYVVGHFPPGRNTAAAAGLLWDAWRSPLLRDEQPARGVVLAHGRPELHWGRDAEGDLVIDLESMWLDFVASAEHLVHGLKVDRRRRGIVLERWRARKWVVRTPASLVAAADTARGAQAGRKAGRVTRRGGRQGAHRTESSTQTRFGREPRYPRGLARLRKRQG